MYEGSRSIPGLEEQSAIAKILDDADEEISLLVKKRVIVSEQKKYLVNNLVTGKIRTPENLTVGTKEALHA